MSNKKFSWELFQKAPIVGIVRNISLEDIKQILPVCREAGLTTVEITMNTPAAGEMIQYAVENEGHGLNIGAGTVCSKEDLEAALEAGADDVIADEEGGFEVVTPVHDFAAVKEALEAAGFKAEVAEVIMKPATETVFTGDDAIKMQKLLDALENLDDVQEVFTNAVIDE